MQPSVENNKTNVREMRQGTQQSGLQIITPCSTKRLNYFESSKFNFMTAKRALLVTYLVFNEVR